MGFMQFGLVVGVIDLFHLHLLVAVSLNPLKLIIFYHHIIVLYGQEGNSNYCKIKYHHDLEFSECVF